MRRRLQVLLLAIGFFSCRKNGSGLVHEYSYAGMSMAQSEQVETLNGITNTIAWDTAYQEKIRVTYNADFTTITMNVSAQTHPCQTFKEGFTFPTNDQNIYTANSDTINASQTFEISSDSLYGYMLKEEGQDSSHATYTLSFKGKLVQ